MEPVPDVSVIIPTHSRRDLLDRILTYLAGLEGPSLEVIVIDDASSDGTRTMLATDHPEVVTLRNDSPRGFDALPDAIARSTGRFVFQLDDDAWPAPGTLATVLEHFERRGPRLGLVALPFVAPGSGRRVRTPFLPDGDRPGPTHGFLAGAVVLRRQAALALPPSPPGYFLQATEPPALIEYLAAGWEADFLPGATVYHEWVGRSRRIPPQSAFLSLRNDIVTFRRYYRGWRRREMIAGRYLTGLLHALSAGSPGAFARAARAARAMLAELPERAVPEPILERVYPCFRGATLTTLASGANLGRAAWLLGLLPVEEIG